MKKILSVLLCLALIISTVGCGGGEKPEQAVSNLLDAIKVADKEAAEKYINYDELMDKDEDESLSKDDEEIYKLLCQDLTYEIKSSEVNGDTAKVEADITNVDMKPILGELFTSLIPLAFSGLDEEQIDEKTKEILKDLMSREDNETVTNTVTIDLSKKDNTWKIDESNELANAILGDLISVQEEMDDSFGG